MSHQIKINRAKKIAPKLPMATKEIWASIPDELIEQLTSKQLASMVNALDAHWHKATIHKENEIIAEGYVWSPKHQKLLDVVIPCKS